MRSVVDSFIKGMGHNTRGTGANIKFTYIDSVEHIVPGFGTNSENFLFSDRIIMELKFGYKLLIAVHNILYQVVVGMIGINYEEYVITGISHFAEYGNSTGYITVTDIILAAVSHVSAISLRSQGHFGRINISTVFFFRKPESAEGIFL